MDILNWIYLKTSGLIRSTANNADTDLIAVGANVGPIQRGDSYQTYAMTLKDLSLAGDVANTAYYSLDYGVDGPAINVTTQKGIVEITNFTGSLPAPSFAGALYFVINNPEITYGNADNIYVQLTPYYKPFGYDNFIPYIIASGALSGQETKIYNASPQPAGTNQGEGLLYIYYELYQIN
jgi:hypothetical protein